MSHEQILFQEEYIIMKLEQITKFIMENSLYAAGQFQPDSLCPSIN